MTIISTSSLVKAASAAILLAAGSAHAQPLVVNGSFEANSIVANSYSMHPTLAGWNADNLVELRNNVVGAAQDGLNFVELDAHHNGSIFQSINTTAGQHYTLRFWYAPRQRVAADSNGISIAWGGIEQGTLTGKGGSARNVWNQYSYDLIGAGNTTELRFAAVGKSDSYGGSLDNVTITAVPEPGTLAMLLLGLGLLGVGARRKRV